MKKTYKITCVLFCLIMVLSMCSCTFLGYTIQKESKTHEELEEKDPNPIETTNSAIVTDENKETSKEESKKQEQKTNNTQEKQPINESPIAEPIVDEPEPVEKHLPGELLIKCNGEEGYKGIKCQDCDYEECIIFSSAYVPNSGEGCMLSATGRFCVFVDDDFYGLTLEEDNKCYANGHYICDTVQDATGKHSYIMDCDVTIYSYSMPIPLPDNPFENYHETEQWQNARALIRSNIGIY